MHPVEYFADIIKQNDNDLAAVCDTTIEKNSMLNRCCINPWNGLITVLQHCKNINGYWDEIGSAIGTIIVDDGDNIKTQIF